ncbi:aminotransferase class I/II-fold pyridoxal phosphate-dependent enzyme [Limimaricola pyoseonensis]|uniref:Cystathionine beta-lyase/cystathionine gamma-synthase n=1 Tax=Limimaricola pyoseonensis TaxID=521013 RepID=A0A1G7HGX4_9RHOB|nr:aminotransferase class I/II-fold pyridoxal phosphate-dependent enzyme [Limimaricola pyoseonensis]SDE99534.1 Cystathionine beta-lyase/cystathionine gamma-synthase [Limimaricola pyoseonensis]
MSAGGDGLDSLLATPHDGAYGEMTPPIYQSSLFGFSSYAEFEDRMAGRSDRPLYSRVQNPTVSAFEQMIARLEGAEAAVGFASGMAAVASTLFALVKPGDRIACITHVYPDSYRLMERMLRPWGVEITYHTPEAFEAEPELLAGARLAYLESPNSMMMEVMDLRAVAGHARRHGVTTVIDSSWATPALLNPVALGIDLVIHSASKYISGHSDTVAGVVAGRADLVARLRDLTLPLLGAKLAPFEAWLLLRGLRTLEARMRQHGRTADLFVDRLAARPEVTRVRSPGANAVPGLRGRSGLMSVEFAENVDIPRFADALKIFRLGVSWGGFESLVVPAAITLRQAGEQNAPQRFGVPPRLVRLSLGLEGAEDLWEDFMQALEVATG